MAVSLSPITSTHPVLSLDDQTAQRAPLPSLRNSQQLPAPFAVPLDSPPSDSVTPAPSSRPEPRTPISPDDQVTQLETQISQLKKYGEELLGLGMMDSYKALLGKVDEMESRVREMRSERARMLLGRLEGEGGWLGGDLRGLVEEEGRRLGYVQ
jgi:hypothetical protein